MDMEKDGYVCHHLISTQIPFNDSQPLAIYPKRCVTDNRTASDVHFMLMNSVIMTIVYFYQYLYVFWYMC